MKNNKKGFTMAELLLTIGIIGIVSSLMLTSITKARPNKELIMLKKAYYNTTRIVAELINDDDLYPERDNDPDGDQAGFANISIADMLGGEAKFHGQEYYGTSKFCGLFAAKMGIEDDICLGRVELKDGGNFTTTDGIVWSMPMGDFSGGEEVIYVDVNGTNNGSNCGVSKNCTGSEEQDEFRFHIGKYGAINIYDPIGQKYINSENVSKKYKDFL